MSDCIQLRLDFLNTLTYLYCYSNLERLIKLIVEKLREAGRVVWREEYKVLTRRYGLEQEDVGGQAGSAAEWKR